MEKMNAVLIFMKFSSRLILLLLAPIKLTCINRPCQPRDASNANKEVLSVCKTKFVSFENKRVGEDLTITRDNVAPINETDCKSVTHIDLQT